MSESPASASAPAVQPVELVEPSVAATALATEILSLESSVTDAIARVARLLAAAPNVDLVAATMIQLEPDRDAGWVRLGERAWLREWRRPEATCSVGPRQDAGPDQALSMPWLSQFARRPEFPVVAVHDAGRLPPEADQDRRELAWCGVRALVSSAVLSDGTMFGSVAVARETPGVWSNQFVTDVHLLSGILGARMAIVRARTSLADAIRRGDQARASQQQFFATIGHELRTPLAAIVGTAELLGSDAREIVEDQPADSPATGFATGVATDADVVLNAGEHLLAIVEDLLSSGQELGGGVESALVDLTDAVDDVIHWVRVPALTAGVTVTSQVEPGNLVLTTPAGLRQILTNLVGNAIAYNHRGGTVAVTSESTQDEFGERRLRISVRDTGQGLTPQQQRDVFKPFVRFAGVEVRGTGLGLSLSRSLAERDGGMMGVESTPGVGSVFWVDLPATADPGH